jgi:hypothetical protein
VQSFTLGAIWAACAHIGARVQVPCCGEVGDYLFVVSGTPSTMRALINALVIEWRVSGSISRHG